MSNCIDLKPFTPPIPSITPIRTQTFATAMTTRKSPLLTLAQARPVLTPKSTEQSYAFPLPTDIPAPTDDGAADHLANASFPPVALPSTSGSKVDVSELSGLTILFCVSICLKLIFSSRLCTNGLCSIHALPPQERPFQMIGTTSPALEDVRRRIVLLGI